jgi:Arc/MetJ-type ribon-helix-helix transcriptional regulator
MYREFAIPRSVVFDNAPPEQPKRPAAPSEAPRDPEDQRIALRCNRKELQLLDSLVANGEYESRSELMRRALHEFLRARALTLVTDRPAPSPTDLVEVPVRLRAAEAETFRAYGRLVVNGRDLGDVLAELVRRGDLELKVSELVERARRSQREDAEARERLSALARSADDLERRGVVGR